MAKRSTSQMNNPNARVVFGGSRRTPTAFSDRLSDITDAPEVSGTAQRRLDSLQAELDSFGPSNEFTRSRFVREQPATGGANTQGVREAQIRSEMSRVRRRSRGGFLNQLGTAAIGDARALDQAERERFERGQAGIQRFADRVEALPGAVADINEDVSATLDQGGARDLIEASVSQGGRAAERFERSIDTTSQAVIQQARQEFEIAERRVNAGINPDGTPMSPAQQQAARRELMANTQQQIGMTLGQVRGQLDQSLAGLRQNAANIGLQGAAQLQNIAQTEASLRSANMARALEAQMAGDAQLAQMRMQHAYSPTSIFDSLLQIGTVATAPGGRNIGRLNFGGSA